MTKPAGVALQLLAVPFIFYYLLVGFDAGTHWPIVVGLLLLWIGGIPAIRKRDD